MGETVKISAMGTVPMGKVAVPKKIVGPVPKKVGTVPGGRG